MVQAPNGDLSKMMKSISFKLKASMHSLTILTHSPVLFKRLLETSLMDQLPLLFMQQGLILKSRKMK